MLARIGKKKHRREGKKKRFGKLGKYRHPQQRSDRKKRKSRK